MTIQFKLETRGWGGKPHHMKAECDAACMDWIITLPVWAVEHYKAWRRTDMSQPLDVKADLRGGLGTLHCEKLTD